VGRARADVGVLRISTSSKEITNQDLEQSFKANFKN
jgi:hypothetical protein